jgi:diguanylate cyclase (GGDEF)-like protein
MSLAEAIDRLEELATEIKREALIDDKTSLGSALGLRQVQRLNRAGQSDSYVVVFGDLNDFKHINDDYSLEAGDVVLRAVGDVIRKKIIKGLGAKAFRHSGDEFVIVLEQNSLTRFLSRAFLFHNIPFSHNSRNLRTGMSLGYAVADGRASFEELLQRADSACQIAKRKASSHIKKWTRDIENNPLVRISGWCRSCKAKISCTLPRNTAPTKMKRCPCCGKAL